MRVSCRSVQTASAQVTRAPVSLSFSRLCGDRPARGPVGSRRSVTLAAPRESASSPIAPEPAKRSSTRRVVDRPDQVEGGLAHAVARRPRVASPLGAAIRAPAVRAGDDPHRRHCWRPQRQADDELDAAVLVAPREHLAEAADERERRRVAVRDERAEAEDALARARARAARATSRLPTPLALPLVDHLEGDLGLGRVRVADVAGDADRQARSPGRPRRPPRGRSGRRRRAARGRSRAGAASSRGSAGAATLREAGEDLQHGRSARRSAAV